MIGCAIMVSGRKSRSAGFTLIELFATLLLLGVFVAVIVPGITRIGAGPAAEADRLRTHLRYAQSLALANNTASWSVQINADSYALLRNGITAPVSWPGETGPVRIVGDGVQITGGTGVLAFDALGAPTATRTITLSSGERSESVIVIGFTGMIP